MNQRLATHFAPLSPSLRGSGLKYELLNEERVELRLPLYEGVD